MSFSSRVSIVCLGLTCTKLYAISRNELGGAKIDLFDCICDDSDNVLFGCERDRWWNNQRRHTPLHHLIQHWIGPRYFFQMWYYPREVNGRGGIFLNKETYYEDFDHN